MKEVNPPLFNQVPPEFKSNLAFKYFTFLNNFNGQVYRRIGQAHDYNPEPELLDADTTSTGFHLYICTNTSPITITLNASPIEGETVKVKVRNAQVTLAGTLDGVTDLVLATQYDTATVVYSDSEWSIF